MNNLELKPVNIRESDAFIRMRYFQKIMFRDSSQEQIEQVQFTLMTYAAKSYADSHPDFPAKVETRVLLAMDAQVGSKEWYEYQPYREGYGDDRLAVEVFREAVTNLAESNPSDTSILLIYVAIEAVFGVKHNDVLLQILRNDEEGAKIEDIPLWVATTKITGFEEWYRDTFNDFIEGDPEPPGTNRNVAPNTGTTGAKQENTTSTQKSSGSGACYIATAVYGSYDCPEVWTLRRFRDYELGRHWYGRAFIRIYYFISPTLVRCFGKSVFFKRIWKGKLDKMVELLQKKGFSSEQYSD